MRQHVHRAIPRRSYRVIPWQKLRRMYKRRFKRLVKSKQFWESILAGVGSSVFGLVFIWLMFFGI